MKRRVMVCMLAVLFCLLFSVSLYANAVPESAETPVTIRFSWWGGDTRHQATLDAISLYMKQNPNVRIEAEYSGFSGYYQKFVTQVVAGNAPDVFQIDQGWISEFNNRGDVFAPLNRIGADYSKFTKQVLDDYCYNSEGNLIVLPFGSNGSVFVYNKDTLNPYLEKFGYDINSISWKEFAEFGGKIHQDNPEVYLLSTMTSGYERFVLKPILEQITNQIGVQDDQTLGFDKGQLAQAFRILIHLFETGAAQPYEESVIYKEDVEDNPLWIQGKVIGSFIFLSNCDRVTDFDFNYGVARLPLLEGAQTSGQESGPSLMLGINKNSKVQAETVKFANWFLNDPEAIKILGTQRGVPVNEKAVEILKNEGLISPIMGEAVAISNATIGFKNSSLEMNASVQALIDEKMEKVIYGKVTPEEGADELITELQKLFKTMNP